MPSRTEFTQLPLEAMQHGLAKPVARVRLSPFEISTRLGINFVSTQDDLDDLDAALIRTMSGRQVAFVRHKDQPLPGTDIVINERSEDPTADLIEAMKVLSVGKADLTWKHPDIDLSRIALSHSITNAWSTFLSAIRSTLYAAYPTRVGAENLGDTILLIEDEYVRKALAVVLHDLGHAVREPTDWKQVQDLRGVQRIITDNPDIAIQRMIEGSRSGERAKVLVIPSSKRLRASASIAYIGSDLEHSR